MQIPIYVPFERQYILLKKKKKKKKKTRKQSNGRGNAKLELHEIGTSRSVTNSD